MIAVAALAAVAAAVVGAGAEVAVSGSSAVQHAYSSSIVVQCDPQNPESCGEGFACAVKDESWAQCVDCSPEQFDLDCPYLWYASLTESAEEACGLTCLGQRGSQCVSIECGRADNISNLTCVASSEDWQQCVDCYDEAFQEDCGAWSVELSSAAEIACNTTCLSRRRLI